MQINVRSKLFSKFKETLPRVDGKIFVITGTTSGTGYVAARTAAELGGTVLLLNRKSERADSSFASLKEEVPEGKFTQIVCDLQDFSSVRSAADDIKRQHDKIYCLANNAGIMATPDKATKDGYDTQMQTNHLSHFLLTAELFPLLVAESEASGDARIVNHSSLGRNHTPNKGLEEKYFGKNGGNLGGDEVKLMGGASFHRYFQSKLANSVFTYVLHAKCTSANVMVRAVAAHPGGSATNLGDHLNFGSGFLMRNLLNVVAPLMMQSAEDGSMGLILGMLGNAESGRLYGPKNNRGRGKPVVNPPKSYENDPAAMDMLWKVSEEATGVKFDIKQSI
mmetsp:Transcript_6728/g.7677  ORF Transcript_6728/g.7677 Transcript_6728/m.7677 type:complete len:336 (+) Transcript_6728:97-1104(+)|eukprot:CAMPEP_0184028910 /NCGR_PEP_ID=MMETSP0954-20121128/15121_1 /TAXON_ID=627963 /ORGANISM="Aplanochytrium sp, Strain PBS07" /LENGTH=335 /DNA_ID=CAMNT_0026313843 /DNA_START=131 /DNA_END=1138 /DNA_ORIENTATION=+